jgi:DNA-binding transcriptional MocR family regulator
MNESIALQPGGTLADRLVATISGRIAARIYSQGEKLPSIRAMAAHMRVSKSTVVEAYDRLVSEGAVASRPGSGFFVAGRLPPLNLADLGPKLDKAIDPLWISRQSLDGDDSILRPGCGWMPPDWMPQEALSRALRALSRDSGTQAIDLVCRFLLEPGDTVLLDDPSYFNFQALLKAHRVKVVGVRYTPKGPDPDVFAKVVEDHNPRLYITNSAVHNPTGAALSPVTAHRILKIAEQSGLIIVEDDIFADFEYTPSARLSAFDGLERVIHIGSFSKTLTAAARCGYIATRPDWIDGLIDLKVAISFSNGRLSAELVLALLKDRAYRKYLDSLRARLAMARHDVATELRAIGIHPWIEPEAGIFLWCKLPDGIDSAELAQKALRENIVLAPGNAFSPSQSAGNFMRFNVTQCKGQHLFQVLARLMR